jgi:diadenylate cyclase
MGELRYLSGPDLLDILVISFLVHRTWVLFRGTAALQVLVGLLFLWVIHGFAETAGLVLTSRFLESLGTVGLLAVVVLFRNEIREVLAQNVPARLLLGNNSGAGRSKRLPAVVEAAFQMAKTRTGALLVFQDRDRLAAHVRDGISLEGIVSAQILQSIFSKESPVHDGAVIIRGNRIERVGAILPLSRQPDLPLEFGTRHRAALGISEVSDAVVVVVSEERGEVSVVRRGVVERIEEPAALEGSLRHYLRREPNRARLANLVRELVRQAAAFLLILGAVAVYWSVYLGRQVSLITVSRPIDFRNIPKDLEMRAPSIDRVEVQIRGKRP